MTPSPRSYTSKELVARIPKLTARKLQYLDEEQILCPWTKGDHQRLYTFSQAVLMAIIVKFRGKGVKLKALRSFVKSGLAIPVDSYIVIEGQASTVVSADRLIETVQRARRGVFVVCVAQQVRLFDDSPEPIKVKKRSAKTTTA